MAEPDIVFIGGVGRSGTSVTREILGLHPNVAVLPFEYRFIIDPDGIIDFLYGHQGMWSPYLFDSKLKRLEALLNKLAKKKSSEVLISRVFKYIPFLGKRLTKAQYLNWELDEHLPEFSDAAVELIDQLSSFAFRGHWVGTPSYELDPKINYVEPDNEKLLKACQGFCHKVLNNWLARNNKSMIVEDNTWNLLYAEKLSLLFPGAKFIHVQRDPRDVVLSFIEQTWMPHDLQQASKVCSDLYKQIRERVSYLDEQRLLSISLESLVYHYSQTVETLAEFCGLDSDENLFKKDMRPDVVGRWKKGFSTSQQAFLSEDLATLLTDLGYRQTVN